MKKLLLITTLLANVSYTLDHYDQGEYILLDLEEQPTPSQMRYIYTEEGWIMDGKKGDGNWYPVCRQSKECKLRDSTEEESKTLQKRLPEKWHDFPFACIQNEVFAFCRLSDQDNPNHRLYWWIPFEVEIALPVNRVL